MEKTILDLFSESILREAAHRFKLHPEALRLISDMENFVYDSGAAENPCILRITHTSHRTLDAIMGELEWIGYLSDHGVSVPEPLPSMDKKLVEVIPGDQPYFLATAFQKTPGMTILDGGECTPEIYAQWGQIVGRMHAMAKHYLPSRSEYLRPEWFTDYVICNAEKYIPDQVRVLDRFHKLIDGLQALPKEIDSYGLIHADLSDVNFFVHDHKITVFDFDDCQYHWFVYDIAVILYDSLPWLPHGEMSKDAFMRYFWGYFMQGYTKENTLERYWLDKLDVFMKLREIYLYLVCHKKWNLNDLSKQRVDYLRELRHHIENDIPCLDLLSLSFR